MTTRREFIQAGGGLAALTLLAGCNKVTGLAATQLPDEVGIPTTDKGLRFLDRIGYGPRPGELDRLAKIGHQEWLNVQLAANQPEPWQLEAKLARIDLLRMNGVELMDLPPSELERQLHQVVILRSTYSPNQLRERMADFWSNHFNLYSQKANGAYYIASDQANVVRKHCLGSFPEMLKASAHSPAMLEYLDNQVNRKGRVNENYAREIMELHSMGVNSGYTQRDIVEVSRCFSGWAVEKRFLRPKGTFRFIAELHDEGPKEVLGHAITAGGGKADGDKVLEILGMHPATARNISRKLCRHFLGHDDDRVVGPAMKTYLGSKGDIKSVLRTILSEGNLENCKPIPRRPLDFLIAAIRRIGADTDGNRDVQEHLNRMGQLPFAWPMPDGYPTSAESWTGSVLARWNFAIALAHGAVGGTTYEIEKLAKALKSERSADMLRLILGSDALSGEVSDAREGIALALASPAFQWR